MGGGGADDRMTDTPLITLLSQNDLDALRLIADDLDRLLLGEIAHYAAQHGSNQPTGDGIALAKPMASKAD